MKKANPSSDPKIRHRDILEQTSYTGLIDGYREKVLPKQTRTIRLLGRKSSAKIINTLLGFEVKASYKRIQCPDMVTARYIRLFSELGCHSIKLPYDPTLTEQLIPVFESIVDSIQAAVQQRFPRDSSRQQYVLRRVYGIIRKELSAA